MRRKIAAALFAAMAVAAMSGPAGAADRFVTVGTDSVTSSYYPAGGAVCRMVNRERRVHGLRCAVEPTGGAVYNINTIRSGELDFGIVRSDRVRDALLGEGLFADEGPYPALRAVFALQSEPLTLMVRAESPYRDVAALQGARTVLGDSLSGERDATLSVLAALGWTAEASAPSDAGAGQDLCADAADVAAFTTAHPSSVVRDAIRCPVRFVPVDGPAAAAALASHPDYREAEVPGGLYPGNPAYVKSLGPVAVLVTSADTPDDVVGTVVRSVFENFGRFHLLHPTLYDLRAEDMARHGLAAPLHDGALRYFREQGWR